MGLKYFLIFSCVGLYFSSYAQKERPSFEEMKAHAAHLVDTYEFEAAQEYLRPFIQGSGIYTDSFRLEALHQTGRALFYGGNSEKALVYARMAKEERIAYYKKPHANLVRAHLLMSGIREELYQYDLALQETSAGISVAEQLLRSDSTNISNFYRLATLYEQSARIYNAQGDFTLSTIYNNLAIDAFKNLGFQDDYATQLEIKGFNEIDQGRLDAGLENLKNALSILSAFKDYPLATDRIPNLNINISDTYFRMGKPDLAIRFAKEALET